MLNRAELAEKLETLSNETFDKDRDRMIAEFIDLIMDLSDLDMTSHHTVRKEGDRKIEIYRDRSAGEYVVSIDTEEPGSSAYIEVTPAEAIEIAINIIKSAKYAAKS